MVPAREPLSYYAEYLPNIKSVTLTLFSSPHDSSIGLSPDGWTVRVTGSSGQVVNIPLPAKCSTSGSGMRIQQDSQRTTIRLPADPDTTSSPRIEETVNPWTATQLSQQVGLSCKSCASVIVKSGTISSWKDLPSEGWAEMMDLWHCHKPDEHHLHGPHDEQGSAKGYAAGSKLVARQGTGFVATLGFLLHGGDCTGVKITQETTQGTSPSPSLHPDQLQCSSCGSSLGHTDSQSEGLKLLKPYLALSSSSSPQPSRIFTTEKWLSAYLLSLIESTGVRKFILRQRQHTNETTDGPTRRDREIWVFSTGLSFTSSSTFSSSLVAEAEQDTKVARTEHPKEALKIFYRTHAAASADDTRSQNDNGSESLKRENLMVEELRLPSSDLEEQLWDILENSTRTILFGDEMDAQGGRLARFGQWHVGLLERFSHEHGLQL